MKKLVALCTTVIIAAIGTMSVSAQEYEVEKGDNLWEIANNNDLTVDQLIDINNLKTTTIHPKQTIDLAEKYTYTVEKGDTLIDISQSENVSVDDLKKWNDLSSNLIVIDEELTIVGSKKDANNKQAQSQQADTDKEASKSSNTHQQAQENKTEAKQASKSTNDQVSGKTISVKATAYTAKCDGCSGVTYTGVNLNQNRDAKVIAVDPDVIPLGSTVYVEGYGYAEAEDIGSAIQGKRVDLHVPTEEEAYNYGVQNIDVTIVD